MEIHLMSADRKLLTIHNLETVKRHAITNKDPKWVHDILANVDNLTVWLRDRYKALTESQLQFVKLQAQIESIYEDYELLDVALEFRAVSYEDDFWITTNEEDQWDKINPKDQPIVPGLVKLLNRDSDFTHEDFLKYSTESLAPVLTAKPGSYGVKTVTKTEVVGDSTEFQA